MRRLVATTSLTATVVAFAGAATLLAAEKPKIPGSVKSKVAKAVAEQDIGQCVVVKDRAVLAVEAIEGTDATILRAGELGGEGACVLKVAKPSQDPRFDVPVIGPATLDVLVKARASVLAFEAGSCLVLGAQGLARQADLAGIAVLGTVGNFAVGAG